MQFAQRNPDIDPFLVQRLAKRYVSELKLTCKIEP